MTIYYHRSAWKFPEAIFEGMNVHQVRTVKDLVSRYREGTESYIMLKRRRVKRGFKLIIAEIADKSVSEVKAPEIYIITLIGRVEPQKIKYQKGRRIF